MTTRDRLHRLVDELSEAEADDALVLLNRVHEYSEERATIGRAIAEGYERIPQTPLEDEWAAANAREAIRDERW